MSNILIIKHGSLGDIAQASGAIQDICENHLDDNIYILTTKPYIDLLKKFPNIKDVILDRRLSRFNIFYLYILMKNIKKLNISKVYDLQNSSRSNFYKIQIPIAIRQSLPAYGNEIILMLKGTSLASTVTLMDLTGVAKYIISTTFKPIEVFIIAGSIYLFFTFIIHNVIKFLEKKYSF